MAPQRGPPPFRPTSSYHLRLKRLRMSSPDPNKPRRPRMRNLRAGALKPPRPDGGQSESHLVSSGEAKSIELFLTSLGRAVEVASQGVTAVAAFQLKVHATSILSWSIENVADSYHRVEGFAHNVLVETDERIVFHKIDSMSYVGFVAGIASSGEAERILGRLVAGLNDHSDAGFGSLALNAHLGAAFATDTDFDVERLMAAAALGLEQTTNSAPLLVVSQFAMQRQESDKKTAEFLRAAVDGDQIEPVYQARGSANDGKLVAIEVFARWQHEERGAIPPREFLRVAELEGILFDLGAGLREKAATQAAQWLERSWLDDITLVFNLSPVEWCDSRFEASMAGLRDRFPALQFAVEVADGRTLDIDQISERLKVLKTLDVGLTLDNVTQQSLSLPRLRRLPLTGINVGGSVVHSMVSDVACQGLSRMLVELAQSKNIPATACQVESREQLQAAEQLGFHHLQGHVLSKPVNAEEIAGLLRAGSAKADKRDRRSRATKSRTRS